MKPETPSDIQVITELDVYEATIRKATHESTKEFSWDDAMSKSDANTSQPKVEPEQKTEPKADVKTSPEAASNTPCIKEEQDAEDLARKELIDKLMADIMKPRTLTPVEEDESFYDDMPALVPDTDETGQQWSVPEDYDWMLALYKKPSCPRCEAALKALMSVPDEESQEETQEEDESQDEESQEEESQEEESDTSDSDYVPSESSSESDAPPPRKRANLRDRELNIPPLIKYTFAIIVVLYILKLLLIMNEKSRYRPCFS